MAMISISKGNIKLGNVPNFSLPAGHVKDGGSCWNARDCAGKLDPVTGKGGCYAMMGTFNFPSVKQAYKANLDAIQSQPDAVQSELSSFIEKKVLNNKKAVKKFRFDVSGDVISKEYRDVQFNLANLYPDVKFLKYTKVYGFYIGLNAPKNLSVLFSWFVHSNRDEQTQLKRFIKQSPNYNMAITSMNALETFKQLRKLGRKPALCPAQTLDKGVNCDKCNLCFTANEKGIDIVFQHHARKADEVKFREAYHGEFKHLRML